MNYLKKFALYNEDTLYFNEDKTPNYPESQNEEDYFEDESPEVNSFTGLLFMSMENWNKNWKMKKISLFEKK